MTVYLVEVTDWDAGEKKVWAVYSNLESVEECKARLENDDELDVSVFVYGMEVEKY